MPTPQALVPGGVRDVNATCQVVVTPACANPDAPKWRPRCMCGRPAQLDALTRSLWA